MHVKQMIQWPVPFRFSPKKRSGRQGRVTVGHTCALGPDLDDYAAIVNGRIVKAEIT
jgi:hypothetical protein